MPKYKRKVSTKIKGAKNNKRKIKSAPFVLSQIKYRKYFQTLLPITISLFLVVQLAIQVFGPLPSRAESVTLLPASIGNYNDWDVNGDSKVAAVRTDDADTTYISETFINDKQSFSVESANVPANAKINSVTLFAIAKESGGRASFKFLVEKGTAFTDQRTSNFYNLSENYALYSWQMDVNPLTNSFWTPEEVNSWTIRFGVQKNNPLNTARVTQIYVIVDYTSPVQAIPNPQLTQSCGLDIALVIDSSGSINNTELAQVKTAFSSFVSAFLPSTPTQFSVTDFSTTAIVLQTFTSDVSLIDTAINSATSGGYTNWEDGLLKAQSTFDSRPNPNLIIFASDGNPNRKGNPAQPVSESEAVDAAVLVANALKSSGTRILALGIGNDLDINNLKAISGPNVDTGITADVITSDFDNLASDLARLASQLCGSTITVRKIIDQDGDIQTTGDQTPGAGWNFDIAGSVQTTDQSGYTQAVEVTEGIYSVTETQQNGYSLTDAFCSGASNNGILSSLTISGIQVASQNIVSCVFYNFSTSQQQPPSPPPSSGGGGGGGGLLYGSLVVKKAVINNDGGSKTAADFIIHIKSSNGSEASGSPKPGSETGTNYNIPTGTYLISEEPVSGYNQVSISGDCAADGTVTITSGTTKTCTITNDDVAGAVLGETTERALGETTGKVLGESIEKPEAPQVLAEAGSDSKEFILVAVLALTLTLLCLDIKRDKEIRA